jgi:hypothetical protein
MYEWGFVAVCVGAPVSFFVIGMSGLIVDGLGRRYQSTGSSIASINLSFVTERE